MKYFMKSICSVLAFFCFITLFSGCSATKKPSTIRVGVTAFREEDTFISTILDNLAQVVKEKEIDSDSNINLYIEYAQNNQSIQNEQIDYFLGQNYDIICVNLVDRTAAAAIIDKAQAADIPVIFFNREPVKEDLLRWEKAYYVGSHGKESGVLQGEIVKESWEKDPSVIDKNGDGIIQYVVLEGERGHQDTLLRTENSVKTLTNSGIPLEKLDNSAAFWQRGVASTKMKEWLTTYGSDIEMVLANNDDMALGAIDACIEMGIEKENMPFIVGVDATPQGISAVENGTLKGTVYNDGAGQAKTMIDLAYAVAYNQSVADNLTLTSEHYIWLPYKIITEETLSEQSE